ncbi:hypothetical protein N9L68_06895, partial [bacterium]|nr:hypothetical protein [bacterium]
NENRIANTTAMWTSNTHIDLDDEDGKRDGSDSHLYDVGGTGLGIGDACSAASAASAQQRQRQQQRQQQQQAPLQ